MARHSTLIPRVGTVVLAAAAATLGWAVAVHGLGVHLEVGAKSATAIQIGAGNVAGASFVAGLAAWALLAFLERRGSRAARNWTIIAFCAFAVSLLGPADGLTYSAKVSLLCLHTLVAAIIILGLRRTAAPTVEGRSSAIAA